MEHNWEYVEVHSSFYNQALNVLVQFPEAEPRIYSPASVLEVLNELGKEGWEMVGVLARGKKSDEGEFGQLFYFKRPVAKKLTSGYSGPLRGTR